MSGFRIALVAYDTDVVPDWVIQQIEDAGIDLVVNQCLTDDEAAACAEGADVVWVFGGPSVVTSRILPSLKQCRVILRSGSGTDNVPVAEAGELGILVANTPRCVAATVAEHAIAMLLAVIRQIPVQNRAVRNGIWDRDHAWPNWHLAGKTLGLAGFGFIARNVARKAAGFDLRIIAFDPVVDAKVMADLGAESVGLEDLFRQSDFLSVHCPLTDKTHHLIGERELRMMKPEAVLINTSRGPVIDEVALVRALTEGWIAAAGLDVLEQEPPDSDNPLLKLDNVVITPHIAGYSDTFWHDFWSHSVRTLIEMSTGRRPLWVVNPDVKPRFELAT